MANQPNLREYVDNANGEWDAMRNGPPFGTPLSRRVANPPPAANLATNPQVWPTLVQPPAGHPQATQQAMGGIMDLFDNLSQVVAEQRSSRVATNSYVLELEKLINKLRDCIDRLFALLQECKDNKIALEELRAQVEQHPNLNLIRDQLTSTITEMTQDQLNPDDFRRQLVDLVAEIERICNEVDDIRREGFGDDGGDGGDGGGGETKNDGGLNGTGGQKSQSDGAQAGQQTMNSSSGGLVASRIADIQGDIGQKMSGRTVAPVSPDRIGSDLYRNPVQPMPVNRATNASLNRNRQRIGGWQTPEKLKSLSKSKPIRTLGSIKKRKGERRKKTKGRRKKTKGRRKKTKGRRNKKKKQTKRKKNKGKRKKQTRKR
tara:strand:+ start:1427 stop:2548 length:1122 start_codon:yes stop_codon:yes gene_type:complete